MNRTRVGQVFMLSPIIFYAYIHTINKIKEDSGIKINGLRINTFANDLEIIAVSEKELIKKHGFECLIDLKMKIYVRKIISCMCEREIEPK